MTVLPNIRPIQIKERSSMVFLEKGQIDVLDGAFVLYDEASVRTQIPIGGLACVFLEPGTRISHRAVQLAADVGTLLIWIGEAGVRLYASGQPGGARSNRLLYQAKLALDDSLRLKVVRHMFKLRFGDDPPEKRSVMQLRGIEGVRVKKLYKMLAKQYGVSWKGRNYNPKEWNESDLVNKCLSTANACLYGITEAAILAAGYAPAIGFLHTGKPLSFVYDIADIVKFETVVPVAFQVAKSSPLQPDQEVRRACRDSFRTNKTLQKLIPLINEVLSAGEIELPESTEYMVQPAFEDEKGIADVGYRN